MKTTIKKAVHFTDSYMLRPTNPVSVNVIGAGGTGSQMLTNLARLNTCLIRLGHPGFKLSVYDPDEVTAANLGRQLFSEAENGLNKGVALINRLNRFFGTNWKAIPEKFTSNLAGQEAAKATLTISCVDSAKARFDIAGVLTSFVGETGRDKPMYWMDFGNSRDSGQVILSTINDVAQPASKKFHTVAKLRMITDEFKYLLQQQDDNDEPSCSLAEALEKQDLFINSSLAAIGSSLLWNLFKRGMTANRGFFLNLEDFRAQPLKVT